MNKIIFLIFSPILLFSSCTQHYLLTRDSYVNNQKLPHGFSKDESTTFAVFVGQKENQLQADQIADKVRKYMKAQGYRLSNMNDAKYVVLVGYKDSVSYKQGSMPFYMPGQTMYSNGYCGTNSFSATSTTPGSVSSIPYTQKISVAIMYLTVYDNEVEKKRPQDKTGLLPPVWKSEVGLCDSESDTEVSDIKLAIDYLIVHAFKDFGKQTHKKEEIYIEREDKFINEARAKIFNSSS